MSDVLEFIPGKVVRICRETYAQCNTKILDVAVEIDVTQKKMYQETIFFVTNLLTGDVHKFSAFDEAVKKYNELR